MRRSLALSFSGVLAAAPSCGCSPSHHLTVDVTQLLRCRCALRCSFVTLNGSAMKSGVWSESEKKKTMNQKRLPYLISPWAIFWLVFWSEIALPTFYARAGDGWRTTVQETWGGSMQSGLQFYGSCAAVPARSLCKKGWEKSDYHPLPGGLWWNSTLKANSNKLPSEATLHFNLCVPPRCLRAAGAHHSRCRRPDTSNPTGTVRLTVIHNGLGTPQRSADGYGWPKCFEGLRLLLP